MTQTGGPAGPATELPDDPRPAAARGLRTVLATSAIGALLGGGAVLADVTTGPVALLLMVLLSSTVAWVAGGLLAGALAARWWQAVLAAVAALLLATWVYYGLILAFGLRPGAGTKTILNAGVEWSVIAVVCGVTTGLLGCLTRHGREPARSIALGLALGLLATQGYYDLRTGVLGLYLPEPAVWAAFAALLTVLVVGTVVVLRLLRRTVLARAAVPAALAAALAGIACWLYLFQFIGIT